MGGPLVRGNCNRKILGYFELIRIIIHVTFWLSESFIFILLKLYTYEMPLKEYILGSNIWQSVIIILHMILFAYD